VIYKIVAAKIANINKTVRPHMPLHSFLAFNSGYAKAQLFIYWRRELTYAIFKYHLGHNSTKTTEVYTHVATNTFKTIQNPLDCPT